VDLRLKTTVQSWEFCEGGVKVLLSDGSEVNTDLILLGVGRRPNTEGIGIEEVGIERDAKGFIKVNEFCQTSIPNIYACGDITSPLMLAHKSMYEAKVAISHMLGEEDIRRDERIVPKIIYSAYEIASVGLTEDQAEEEGYEVKVGVVSFVSNPKAMDDGENEGFVRIVADEEGTTTHYKYAFGEFFKAPYLVCIVNVLSIGCNIAKGCGGRASCQEYVSSFKFLSRRFYNHSVCVF